MPQIIKFQKPNIISPLKRAKELLRQIRVGVKEAKRDVRELGDELKGGGRP